MAAKDNDETVAMFSPKRPRIESDGVFVPHRACSMVADSSGKTSSPLAEAMVTPCFNDRPSCPDVENAKLQVHHDHDGDGEKAKNQITNNNNNQNNNNIRADPRQQSMEEEEERRSDVRNRTNLNDGTGDVGEEIEEGRRVQGPTRINDKFNTEQQMSLNETSEEKEMDTKNMSFSHDPDMDNPDDDLDNVSEISDLAALDEEAWRPVSGPLNWVQRQMSIGRNPRMLFKELISPDTFIPPDLDEMTLWGLLANFITEPPKRKKLNNINTIDDVVHLLKTSKKIMVLTGAGVSVSCGIPDFRSRDGIYARLAVDFPDLPDPQAMFDINYFRNDPRPFFKFAKEIYPGQFEPSKCHKFIKLIEDHDRLLHNYTQNIDTLEQQAGIRKVIQCHGSFATATCMKCSSKLSAESIREDIFQQVIPKCPKCPPECSTAIMKPDIVFFGENLPELFHYQMAEDKEQCDLLIVIGSSMKVRPVALIPNYIPAHVPQILINREPLSHMTFDVELLGDGDIIVNDLCKRLGGEWRKPFCDPGPVSVQVTKDQLEISNPATKLAEKSLDSQVVDKDMENKMENSKGNSINNVMENDTKLSENGQEDLSLYKKSTENVSCTEQKTSNYSESHERMNEICKMEENGENIDHLKRLWKKNKHRKQSLARHLKDNQVLFLPPCQYAYPGAEIYSEEEEEEEEEDLLGGFESHNSESTSSSSGSSWESFSDEDDKKSSMENGIANSVVLHPSNLSATELGADGVVDGNSSHNTNLTLTDLNKNLSGPATVKSAPTDSMFPTADCHVSSSSDPLLLELSNPGNAEEDGSKTISSSLTLNEGQKNGFIDKTEDKNSSTAVATNTCQYDNKVSIGEPKSQYVRTEYSVSTVLSTTATPEKHTEMDVVRNTLTLMSNEENH